MNKICCNNVCAIRFSCVFFSNAMDYVAARIGGEYNEIVGCNGEKYLKK